MLSVEDDAKKVKDLLQNLDQTSPVNVTILDASKKDKPRVNLCVTFDAQGREASPEAFKQLKLFSLEEGYDFNEEVDTHPEGYKIYFYILTLGSTPF